MQLRGPQIANPHNLRGSAHADSLRATAALYETLPRWQTANNCSVLATGKETLVGIELPSGLVVSAVAFHSGSTAFTPGTNQWFTLRDSGRNKLAITADDGVTAWSGNTQKLLYLSRSVTDAVATATTAVITSATAAFTSADVGKQITFMGAGAAGVPLGTSAARVTINSVDSATQITVSANAGTTVASNGTLYIATPYTTTTAGLFYLGITMVGTVPTLVGSNPENTYLLNQAPILCGNDQTNTGLTTPATAVSPTAAITVQPGFVYAYVA